MTDYADVLLAELEASKKWPPDDVAKAWREITHRRAFRINDRPVLKALSRWDRHTRDGLERDYVIDPLARLIAKAFSDFLFGEAPVATTEATGDQGTLDSILKENKFEIRAHRGEQVVISEGEAWWKLLVNRDVCPFPQIEFTSRLCVIPLFYGERVLACAFINEQTDASDKEIVWRHLEVHTDLRVVNRLYRGDKEKLGTSVKLDSITATEGLQEEWQHGLPILAGRVVNDIDEDPTLGLSEYDAVQDQLLALNEASTIAVENARLTAKDRYFVAGKFREADGTFDASMDVYELNQGSSVLGDDGPNSKLPILAVEKTFDAEPLILHMTELTRTILSRVGLVPEIVGQKASDAGRAESGTAIRLRFLPTVNAALGKAREWSASLPVILDLLLKVNALSVDDGGFGGTYVGKEPPAVALGDVLPVDNSDDVNTHVRAVTGEIESRFLAVQSLHPDWTEDKVQEELDRIIAETSEGFALPTLPPTAPVA